MSRPRPPPRARPGPGLPHRGTRAAKDAPVRAVTAHAGRDSERRVLAAGFDGYICKPVDLQTLARAILRATGSG